VPVHSISELISYGKKNPNKLFYGTTGVGSMHHLGGVQLAHMAGINLEHVPYKGGSPTINDAVGGQIPVVILTASTILPYARIGKLRPLGIIEGRKIRLAPEIPSISETVPGYAVPDTWFGIVGPAGLPRPIVERLNVAFRQAITAPEVKQRLEGNGFEITGTTTADEFASFIKSDIQLVTKIVTAAGIKPE
jgi:tripartite-type tricarboxylate transporter receptor subunit TctC